MYESEELASKVLLAWSFSSFSSKQKSKDEPYNNPEIFEGGDFYDDLSQVESIWSGHKDP